MIIRDKLAVIQLKELWQSMICMYSWYVCTYISGISIYSPLLAESYALIPTGLDKGRQLPHLPLHLSLRLSPE